MSLLDWWLTLVISVEGGSIIYLGSLYRKHAREIEGLQDQIIALSRLLDKPEGVKKNRTAWD